ncbi:MAG: calcium/sodium antiporter [Johnsonella sp.]|nr:calcium/sodium antiporter [Johnsonella sp.]
MNLVLLLIGFLLLVKGADFFVEGSSSLARLLRVPSAIIGLTVVAFGTSTPESAVSITAAIQGSNNIALANIIGSNIFNLLMVIGVCALIRDMHIDKQILKKDYTFNLLITVVLIMVILDAKLSRVDGALLLLFFAYYLYDTIRRARNAKTQEEGEGKTLTPLLALIVIAGGLAAIVFGGNLVVDSAKKIALDFGLSETFVGLTIVAIGTSLPELVTSVVASRKGENGLALGNVIGSNIFNILFILGFSSVLSPLATDAFVLYDMGVLMLAMLITWFLAGNDGKISRKEGLIMLGIYLSYMVYIVNR